MIGQRPPGAPPAPEHWPTKLQEDAELILMDAVNRLHAKFGGLIDQWGDDGVAVDWDKSPAREWIFARLGERLFPRWEGLRWRRMTEGDEPS